MQDLFSLWSVFVVLFFIAVALFFLLMPLNVLLFSFMTGFNSNWFICVGFINLSLFLVTCVQSSACDGHHTNVEHSELIDSV
jgi:hypothetical protein